MSPYWQRIADFWKEHESFILAEKRNEWAIDPYAWEEVIRMTPIENWLWQDMREANAVFYPQWPVGGVFVDFANPRAKVAIECDGAAYHQDKEKDAARDERLEAIGWTVYRITGKECRTERTEEYDRQSFAHYFVNTIADAHGLKRLRSDRPMDIGDGAIELINRIIERNESYFAAHTGAAA